MWHFGTDRRNIICDKWTVMLSKVVRLALNDALSQCIFSNRQTQLPKGSNKSDTFPKGIRAPFHAMCLVGAFFFLFQREKFYDFVCVCVCFKCAALNQMQMCISFHLWINIGNFCVRTKAKCSQVTTAKTYNLNAMLIWNRPFFFSRLIKLWSLCTK